MVLRGCGIPRYDLPELRTLCGTRSVWTIDLAHLLCCCGVRGITLCTLTLGANLAYAGEPYYAASLADDCERVERLFKVSSRGLGAAASWG